MEPVRARATSSCYFAEQNGITPDQARALISKYGNDRATLTAEAQKLRQH